MHAHLEYLPGSIPKVEFPDLGAALIRGFSVYADTEKTASGVTSLGGTYRKHGILPMKAVFKFKKYPNFRKRIFIFAFVDLEHDLHLTTCEAVFFFFQEPHPLSVLGRFSNVRSMHIFPGGRGTPLPRSVFFDARLNKGKFFANTEKLSICGRKYKHKNRPEIKKRRIQAP